MSNAKFKKRKKAIVMFFVRSNFQSPLKSSTTLYVIPLQKVQKTLFSEAKATPRLRVQGIDSPTNWLAVSTIHNSTGYTTMYKCGPQFPQNCRRGTYNQVAPRVKVEVDSIFFFLFLYIQVQKQTSKLTVIATTIKYSCKCML